MTTVFMYEENQATSTIRQLALTLLTLADEIDSGVMTLAERRRGLSGAELDNRWTEDLALQFPDVANQDLLDPVSS